MKAFTTLQGLVAPLDRPNVDTDAIIPKQYLKSIKRSGFGPHAFDDWRYLDAGDLDTAIESRRPNPEFMMNMPRYQGAEVLLARENFGCGSSREHAVWALEDAGFRCVIAPSYADIFFSNCFKNGVLPIILNESEVEQLFIEVADIEGYSLDIDLLEQTVTTPSGQTFRFDVDAFRKNCMLEGLDDIGLTLKHEDEIRAFEERHKQVQPWLFR